jgi:hypothetical protein
MTSQDQPVPIKGESGQSAPVNTSVTIARRECPECERDDVAIRGNFTYYIHSDAQQYGYKCIGPAPEMTLALLLWDSDLDVRSDAGRYVNEERAWLEKRDAQRQRDAERWNYRHDKSHGMASGK